MIIIFITLGSILADSGLSNALIQNRNPLPSDFSTVFLFNICIGLFIYLVLYLCAPLIADFFDQPLLVLIIRVASLNIIISSFSIVQNSVFSRDMNFRVLTKISLLSILISGMTGIILAYFGFGVWALIAQGILMSVITSTLLWYFSEWKPSLVFSRDSFKSLYQFGSKLMLANIINSIFQNIYLIVIGKIFTIRELGFYSKAESLARAPVQNIYSIFYKVFFPAFSMIQDDNLKLKLVFKKVLKTSSFIVFPIMLGLIPISKPFILLILTEKWDGSIIYLQILCLTFLLYPFHALNLNILIIKKRSDLVLKLEYFKKGIIVLAVASTFKIGLLALIIGQLISSLIAFFINSQYSGRLINYPVSEQLKDMLPYSAISLITALLLFVPVILLGEEHLLQLVIQLIFGTLFYIIVSRWVNLSGYNETRKLVIHYTSDAFSRFKK